MKNIKIIILEIIHGLIGFFLFGLSLIAVLHPDSSPGTKEWEDDKIFIPVGYAVILTQILFNIFIHVKLKSDKHRRTLFFGTMLLTMSAAAFLLFAATI